VSFALRLYALPLILPLLFFIEIPTLNTDFFIALIAGGLLNVATTILYLKAIEHSDLSITVPFITFTPLFLLITSPLIIGEFPNLWGFVGVLLIVFGSYIMNLKLKYKSKLEPFKAILKEKGPRYMLAVAFLWSISANFDKMGIANSSSLFWAVAISLFLTILMFVLLLLKSRQHINQLYINFRGLLPVGIFTAMSLIFYVTAIEMTLVAYVISIKRCSALISVVFGYFVFKEKGIKDRLIGTIIMLLGVLVIALLGL
jgi:uncharacterized membrane protein